MKVKYLKDRIFAYKDNTIMALVIIDEKESFNTYIETLNNEATLEAIYRKLIKIAKMKHKNIVVTGDFVPYIDTFTRIGFIKIKQEMVLLIDEVELSRYIIIGNMKTGPTNCIGDVKGVTVGHYTVHGNNHHTGVTAILPHQGNMFKEKLIGAGYAYNGFGKSIGLVQVKELGTIETPILITNTLNVGKVADGLISYCLEKNPEIGISTGTINPLVFECNDSKLNDIRNRIINEKNVYDAINSASSLFKQGSVGAGSGMRCLGFKGGIGSSSRIFNIQDKEYTLGVIVNSNFQGGNCGALKINGVEVGKRIKDQKEKELDSGSIIVIIATDLPLESRQLERIAKRAAIGIGRTGSYAGNGSGDVFLAFSTAYKIPHSSEKALLVREVLLDNYIDKAFEATTEAVEEAIINSMLYSRRTVGFSGYVAESISEYIESFEDLLMK